MIVVPLKVFDAAPLIVITPPVRETVPVPLITRPKDIVPPVFKFSVPGATTVTSLPKPVVSVSRKVPLLTVVTPV